MVSPMSLATALKRVLPFFAPENLAQTKIDYDPKPGETALLIIDVQREYCAPFSRRGTLQTHKISSGIKRLTPAFRAAGIPTYVVYYDEADKPLNKVDFYKLKPGPQDIAVRKYTDSAFRSGKLRELLEQHGRKKLLVCGFNLSACVAQTVEDARREGYDVTLLRDLTGNDSMNSDGQRALEKMSNLGVEISTAKQVLRKLH